MSVKLLSHDAKQLFEQRVMEWRAYIQNCHEMFERVNGFAFGSSYHHNIIQSISCSEQERQKQLSRIKELATMSALIKELREMLEKSDLWQKTSDQLVSIECSHSPGWAKSVFKKEVKGWLFLCCNAFFEVRGVIF
jgi:hypothetical protein